MIDMYFRNKGLDTSPLMTFSQMLANLYDPKALAGRMLVGADKIAVRGSETNAKSSTCS